MKSRMLESVYELHVAPRATRTAADRTLRVGEKETLGRDGISGEMVEIHVVDWWAPRAEARSKQRVVRKEL